MKAFRKIWLLLFVVFVSLGNGQVLAEKRVALVVGNSAYVRKPELSNPQHDAEDVSAALEGIRFEVILAKNLGQVEMQDATIRFARAAQDADIALFYYSGHAVQFNGISYLMPVDVKLDDEADLKRFVRVDDILNDLKNVRGLRILVLDTCRNDPLAENRNQSLGPTGSAPVQRGSLKVGTAIGTIVSYSTQAGQPAEDGRGRNSPYTSAFIKHIAEPKEIGEIFREISADAYETSGRSQLPELSLSMVGKFYLNGPAAGRNDHSACLLDGRNALRVC